MVRVSIIKGDEDGKQMYLGKLKEIMREKAGEWQLILYHATIGFDESQRGNYETAKKLFADSLAMAKRTHQFHAQMVCTSEIAHIERHTGNLTQAKAIYQETIKGWQKLGNRSAIANQLECYAFIAIIEEEPHRAAKLLGAAEALREKAQTPMADYERGEYNQSVTRLRSMLAEAEFNTLRDEGRSMTMEQAIGLALS